MSKNKKIIIIFHLKIIIFIAVNNRCILHGRVIVMCTAYALELARNLEDRFSHKAAHKCGVPGGRNWACLNGVYSMNFMALLKFMNFK